MKTIIGMDISKKTLDICIKSASGMAYCSIANEAKAIRAFFGRQPAEAIIAMENTGRYNWPLYEVLADCTFGVFVLSPLHLKKSLGLIRGKNDQIDARRIADFAEKHYQELPRWKPTPALIRQLGILFTKRAARIRMRKQLRGEDFVEEPDEQLLCLLSAQIKAIEEQMEALIHSDVELKQRSEHMRSIPGVGKVLCWLMLIRTANFTTITDPRKMACYCGVVPFDYQSGSSVRGRTRVSQYADKTLKTILHMAAMRAIRLTNDLQSYYQRKVAEGKNKMSVLNVVRNKIIHRIFALIKNQTFYQPNLILS